jgi:DNA-binding transcriptional LysR family regulator
LAAYQLLRFSQSDGIRLTDGKQSFQIAAAARLQADDFETLRGLASLGDGIVFLPSFLCAGEEKRERLVRVLPRWRGEKVSLSIVYPAQKFVPAKVRAFIAVADEILTQN